MKGNLNPVIQHFKTEMKKYAGDMQFEKADITRKKLEHLENYRAKSIIVSKYHLSPPMRNFVQSAPHIMWAPRIS